MIFGISGTKRTVRNREVSVRRGYTVSVFFGHEKGVLSVIESDRKLQTKNVNGRYMGSNMF